MDDDGDEKDDTKRKSRNLSEKKRRDQFNLLINELNVMVSSTNRKMDKSTVLKSTIAFLKNHNEIALRSRVNEIQEDWKPAFLSNEEFTHLVLEALDGFIMVFSANGKICYVSESITALLGHLPGDLLHMNIYDLVYEEDHSELYNLLLNPINVVEPLQNVLTTDNQICFSCHLKRGGLDFCEDVSYELVQFVGYFRNDLDINTLLPNSRSMGYINESDSKLLFVGTSRIQTPQLIREMSIVDSTKNEFTSRHSLEWKFLFLDHRAPPIIGYLPFEVLGTSGYDYYHFDDLEKVVMCHEDLIQKGEGTSCYYRFLTKGQQWIWLQTRYYITYHQWNSKPEFVVCTHRVINYVDVIKQLRNQQQTSSHAQHSLATHHKANELIVNNVIGNLTENNLQQTISVTKTITSTTNTTTTITTTTATTTFIDSPWANIKNCRSSRFPSTRSSSPNIKSRHNRSQGSYQDPGSDTTSMSTDSMVSRHSVMTHYSSYSKMRQPVHQSTTKISLEQDQREQQQSFHQQDQPFQHLNTQQSQLIQHPNMRTSSIVAPHMMSSTFLEPLPQYLTAIPVQPIIASGFPATATVLSSIQPPATNLIHSPGIVMTSTQSHIQDQLHRKHDELQQLIVQQQEELRRVSEQLLMARYGLLPSMVNVTSSPVPSDICQTNNRLTNTNYNSTNNQQEPPQHHIIHSSQQILQIDDNQHQQPAQHHLQQQQQQNHHQQSHMHCIADQQINTNSIMSSHQHQQSHADDMISYMQLTSNVSSCMTTPRNQHLGIDENVLMSESRGNLVNSVNQHQHQHQHQHHQHSNELEVMPYQMPEEQAQILFNTSPSSTTPRSQ